MATWINAFLVVCLIHTSTGAGWSYEGATGPDFWKDSYPKCGLNSQSPIDIITSDATYDKSFASITYTGYGSSDQTFTLKNTGHGVQVDISGGTNIGISAGGLPGNFKLVQFHVHWGTSNTQGSEHRINGQMYPMEVHLVHYNTKYADISTALPEADGLAVIGAFFEIGDTENTYIKRIVDNLGSIAQKDQTTSITAFTMDQLLPSKSSFYRYSGSLTTPSCDESVTWTVLDDTIKITQAQMDAFRSGLYDATTGGSEIKFNYRPPQALNGRTVTSNFDASSAGHVTAHVTASLLALTVALFM